MHLPLAVAPTQSQAGYRVFRAGPRELGYCWDARQRLSFQHCYLTRNIGCFYAFTITQQDSRTLHNAQPAIDSTIHNCHSKMVHPRRGKKVKDIKLRQPDRSGPTEKTLLQIAEDQNLFNLAAKQQRKNKSSAQDVGGGEILYDAEEDVPGISSAADRLMDTLLYAVCLAMLHFTLDFLVQHQYAMEIEYREIIKRAFQALMGSSLLQGRPFICVAE